MKFSIQFDSTRFQTLNDPFYSLRGHGLEFYYKIVHRGSCMSAYVLLNLSNKGKEIKCEAYQVYHIITTC